jgi:hypothetical protein
MPNVLEIELPVSLEKRLERIEKAVSEVMVILKKQNSRVDVTDLLTRKAICKIYGFSPATLDRRVADGSIEKILALGAKSPRYRLVVPVSSSGSGSDILN